jgi:hypothetical protein
MDLRWQEEQRAFQARVLIDENPDLGLRPYRTFVGTAALQPDRTASRAERLTLVLICGAILVLVLLAFGVARELAALAASFTGGVALMVAVSPPKPATTKIGWTPLLAVYSPSVMRGARPACVTQISVEEFDRLGVEGFGTVVGNPRPGATFGLFVDDYLVWPRTPPRGPDDNDPGFGAA